MVNGRLSCFSVYHGSKQWWLLFVLVFRKANPLVFALCLSTAGMDWISIPISLVAPYSTILDILLLLRYVAPPSPSLTPFIIISITPVLPRLVLSPRNATIPAFSRTLYVRTVTSFLCSPLFDIGIWHLFMIVITILLLTCICLYIHEDIHRIQTVCRNFFRSSFFSCVCVHGGRVYTCLHLIPMTKYAINVIHIYMEQICCH